MCVLVFVCFWPHRDGPQQWKPEDLITGRPGNSHACVVCTCLWVSCNILLVPLLMNDSNMSLTHVHLYLYENHDFLFKFFFFFFNQFEGHPLRWIHLTKLVNGAASEVHLLSSLSPVMSFPGSQRWISSSNRI